MLNVIFIGALDKRICILITNMGQGALRSLGIMVNKPIGFNNSN